MIRIGVLGAGHLGKIHLKLIRDIPGLELVGFYDPDADTAAAAESAFAVKRFPDMLSLIEACDAVDIVTPTLSHFTCAREALKRSRHVFIEKPLANTVQEAKQVLSLVSEARVKAQVGHVERFNPAYLAAQKLGLHPMFIEAHRLSGYNPRGTDVSVVLDLMIHDIDIALHLVQSGVKHVYANGVAVVSRQPDIANARIEFDNGCVANLTASRISVKRMRKMRLFQQDAYISIDFAEKMTEIMRLKDAQDGDPALTITLDTGAGDQQKAITFERPEIPAVNSIEMELTLFAKAIREDTETPVPVSDGYHAMQVAHTILHKIYKNPVFQFQ